MDAILFKMISRSMIIIAMIITLLFFLIKRKKLPQETNKSGRCFLKNNCNYSCVYIPV